MELIRAIEENILLVLKKNIMINDLFVCRSSCVRILQSYCNSVACVPLCFVQVPFQLVSTANLSKHKTAILMVCGGDYRDDLCHFASLPVE